MDDLVSRQKVLQCIKESRENIDWGQSEDGDAFLHYSAALYRTIASKECLPSAERKRIRGKWIYGEKRKFIDLANADRQYKELGYPHRPYINMECSSCHKITIADETIQYNFCPHCGADMRKQKLQYGDEDTSKGGLMSAT